MTVDAPPAPPAEPAAAPPPAKKARAGPAAGDEAAASPPVIRPSLRAPASAAALAAAFAAAAPFPHAQLADVVDPVTLRAARDEIVEHVQATYKETDLFKVFQTGEKTEAKRGAGACAGLAAGARRQRPARPDTPGTFFLPVPRPHSHPFSPYHLSRHKATSATWTPWTRPPRPSCPP
jgi:hypothetical protein